MWELERKKENKGVRGGRGLVQTEGRIVEERDGSGRKGGKGEMLGNDGGQITLLDCVQMCNDKSHHYVQL